ncbi:MAG: autotransporter domain-containing protein, partial [Aquisalinus sp.]|nr:autotransporter domain-containing protein [Aquisalinus sp.]
GQFSIQTVNQTGSQAFVDLAADSYIVTQAVNEDYSLREIDCSNGDEDGGSIEDKENRSATIDLDPNEHITCTFISEDLVDEDRVRHMSVKATKGFAYRRARNMLNAEPDRTNFYRRNPEVLWEENDNVSAQNRKPVRYAMNANGGNVQFDFAASTERSDMITPEKGLQLWVEGHYTKADDGVAGFGTQLDIDSEYGIVHLGADFHVNDKLILGALVSFDRASDEIDFFDDETQERLFQEVDGTGWMAGPYLSARLSKNLFLNARAAFGSSTNNLTIENLVQDDEFETDRTLGRVALTGNKVFQENWRITPTLSVSYFRESINDYISNTGVAIPSQTLELGRAEFEPELAYRHAFPDGTTIEPQFSVAAIWDFEAPDDIAFSNIPVPNEDVRARFESAVQLNWANGNSARFATSYDGFGAQDYSAYAVEAWVDIPLGRPMRRSRPVTATPTPYVEPVQYKECPDGSRIEMLDDCPVVLIDMPPPEPVEFVIYFDFDKSNILPEEMAKIDDAVARTQGRSINIIILEGNTDRAGSNAYNDALSVRRAVSVRKALVERGIPEELIKYDAFGEENPAVQTRDGVPLRANRRTEVRIRFN